MNRLVNTLLELHLHAAIMQNRILPDGLPRLLELPLLKFFLQFLLLFRLLFLLLYFLLWLVPYRRRAYTLSTRSHKLFSICLVLKLQRLELHLKPPVFLLRLDDVILDELKVVHDVDLLLFHLVDLLGQLLYVPLAQTVFVYVGV